MFEGGLAIDSDPHLSQLGERAFSEQATDDELRRMQHLVQEALRAGAIGCSLMTVVCGALFFGWDAYKSRQEDRLATSVVEDTSEVEKPAPQ